MQAVLLGGLLRGLQALAMAAPTLLAGLLVAALLRYYLGREGTQRLFGGNSLWSLPQAWLVGMLLPVCSIGVLPVLREMHRQGVRAGALTAFALAAPLFNPLSLLYGLTLSRPAVIIGYALGSLLIVTVLGLVWDRLRRSAPGGTAPEKNREIIGLRRLWACGVYCLQELAGPTGGLVLLGAAGMVLLGMVLPHGALQTSVEQLDPWAVPVMATVAIPVYATPLLAMSQLGSMFDHGNSPGAAFALLTLGTGVNLATLWWIGRAFGWRPMVVWLATLVGLVLAIGWGVDRPLITPGVQPAGHTHAFDIYTNPCSGNDASLAWLREQFFRTVGLADRIAAIGVLAMLAAGAALRLLSGGDLESRIARGAGPVREAGRFDRIVPPRVVGLTLIAGLVALSIVGCYAWYPSPEEALEEIRLAKVETLQAARTGDVAHARHWMPVWEDWTRRLEVGYAIRQFRLSPFQRMKARLVREKLELLEHELEHDPLEREEISRLVADLDRANMRMRKAFQAGPVPATPSPQSPAGNAQ